MTKEQKEILAFALKDGTKDPDAWYAHAVKVRGEEQAKLDLAAKCERWRPAYLASKN